MPFTFQYDADVLARFPQMRGGVLLARGLQNGPSPDSLQSEYLAEQQNAISRLGESMSEIPALAAWRSAFRAFGVEPTQYRCAAEALLRRLKKFGDIPSINTLVDIGNLISIRYALPTAVCDTALLQTPVTVHFADGSERYTPLGETSVENPIAGEVVFTDATGLVVARRWCWRQSDHSASRETTSDVLITIEAQHSDGETDVTAALEDLVSLLRRYAGYEDGFATILGADGETSITID